MNEPKSAQRTKQGDKEHNISGQKGSIIQSFPYENTVSVTKKLTS